MILCDDFRDKKRFLNKRNMYAFVQAETVYAHFAAKHFKLKLTFTASSRWVLDPQISRLYIQIYRVSEVTSMILNLC